MTEFLQKLLNGQKEIVEILDAFTELTTELTARKKQYNVASERSLHSIENLERIQKLEIIENLEQIKNLEHTNITITNLDYKDVKITTPAEESIIYIDPPYRQTQGYKVGLDHNELDEWFQSNPYTCFMTEYNAPHKCIFEIQKQKLANNKNVMKREYAIEKLFWNEK